MKKIKHIALFSLLLAAVCAVSVSAENESAYSTENDPLVTLSYVEKVKSQIYADVMAEVKSTLDKTIADAVASTVKSPEGYIVVELEKGQSLMAGDACEMILHSGSAIVVVTDQINIDAQVGLSDLTAASELLVNTEIPRNHYIIVSRGDGRGMCATSDYVYFLVRGEYEIVK